MKKIHEYEKFESVNEGFKDLIEFDMFVDFKMIGKDQWTTKYKNDLKVKPELGKKSADIWKTTKMEGRMYHDNEVENTFRVGKPRYPNLFIFKRDGGRSVDGITFIISTEDSKLDQKLENPS